MSTPGTSATPAGSETTLGTHLAELYARAPRGMRLGVEAMQAAITRLGVAPRARVVHLAGTNGKGSVAAMLESALCAAGQRVGLATSPHLVRFAERIRIDGRPLDDAALEQVLAQALRQAPELSFFEAAILTSLLAFQQADLDTVILEVGLGGRFDATNAVPETALTAITSIGLDHQEWLGQGLDDIAFEKAGILRPGVPCVLGLVPEAARRRIEQRAAEVSAPLWPLVEGDPWWQRAAALPLRLRGPHQVHNAAIALRLAEALGVDADVAARGVAAAEWPGRLETVQTAHGPVLLDGAHNADGAAALVAALETLAITPRVLVFGALADKDAREMLGPLARRIATRVYVEPGGRAAFSLAALAALAPGETASSIEAALRRARELAGPGELVLVAGSLHLVGSARALLLDLPRDPTVAL